MKIFNLRHEIIAFNRLFFSLFPRPVARKLKGKKTEDLVQLLLNGQPLDLLEEVFERAASVRFDEVTGEIKGSAPLDLIVAASPL